MYVILFYDIADFNSSSKRKNNANRIRKTVEQYLPRVQYSVFEGSIRPSDFKRLKEALKKEIVSELDSIVIYIFEKPSFAKREVIGVDKNSFLFT